MTRDAHIPVFLWVATAALVHILWGWEANSVATAIESRENVRRFAQSVKRHVNLKNQSLEITLVDLDELERVSADRSDKGAVIAEPEEEPDANDDRSASEAPSDAKEAEVPQAHDPPEEKEPEPPKPEEKKAAEEQDEEKVQQAELVPLRDNRRISVQQQTPDKEQPDNPDAEYLADEANHVEVETQARITSSDQNSGQPNPGTNQAPPAADPGNAPLTEIGQADDTKGDPEKAPAESPEDGKDHEVNREVAGSEGGMLQGGEPARVSHGENPNSRQQAKPEARGQAAQAAQEASEAHSELMTSERGAETAPGLSEARKQQHARVPLRRQRAESNARKSLDLRGFGSMNTTPGGLNPNLNPHMALSAIGSDRLAQERRADGQRRRSKHRGSWATVGLEKWRSAIENYVATVQPGNQTALNTARSPFASYLNRIHQRLHPVFADSFLGSLNSLPSDHALNRPDMRVFLEIVVSREDGRLIRMGVTRASGNTAFDVGALESVQRAAPFGPPPSEIVSPDGNVYLHWEFHRDPIYACSTYFARPYLLRMNPTPAPQPVPPARPVEPEELPAEGQRHGVRIKPEKSKDG